MNFSEKVKRQKKKEREVFRLSCELIEETALGSGGKKGPKGVALDQQSDQLINAINQVTNYYEMAPITIPRNALEDEGLLDTVLGRVSLKFNMRCKMEAWINSLNARDAEATSE